MPDLVIKARFQGGSEESKKLADMLRSVGVSADQAAPSVKNLEDKIADLEAKIKTLGDAHREHKKVSDDSKESLEGFADSIVRKFESPIQSARTRILQFAEEFGKIPAIAAGAAVGIAITTDKLFKMAEAQAFQAQAVVNMSTRLGLGIKETDLLGAAAKIAGIDIGALEGASRQLAVTLQDTTGMGERTRAALLKIGVDAQDAGGNFKETGTIITEVLGKLSQIPDTATRIKVAYDTLGRYAATGLQPLIEDYDQLIKLARQAGVGTEEDITRKLADAAKQIRQNEVAWDEFKKSLSERIAPIEIHVIRYITDIVTNAGRGAPSATNLVAPSPVDVANQAIQETQFVPGAVPLPDRFKIPSGLDTEKSFADEALKKRLNEEATKFKQTFDKSEDGLKARLEKLRPEIQDLVGKLSQRDPNRAADDKALKSLMSEQAGIQATLKAIEQRKELLKKLDDLEKTANEKGGIDQTLNPIRKLIQERDDLLAKLGPGSADRINDVYDKLIDEANKTRNLTLDKMITKSQEELDKFVKERAEQAEKASKEDAEMFKKSIERNIQKNQEELSKLKPFGEFFTGQLKKSATFAADSAIKQAGLTPGADERSVADFTLQKRVELAKQIYDIELAAAEGIYDAEQKKYALLEAEAELQESIDKAREERETKYLELRKKSLEDYREASGKVFDALKSHNLQGLVMDTITSQERAIFQNMTTGLFKAVGGQLGDLGKKSGLGSLLQGTLFDPRNSTTPIDKNTTSLDSLRVSVDSLTVTLGGTPGQTIPGLNNLPLLGGGSSNPLALIPGLATFGSDTNGLTGSDGILQKILGPSVVGALGAFGSGLGTVVHGGLFAGISGTTTNNDGSVKSELSTGQRIGNIAASAAAVAAGTLGVISGIKEGGARGVLGASSSALGVASLIPGPQQPFIATAAAITSLVSGLLGDPKVARAHQLASELDAAQVGKTIPVNGVDVMMDAYGHEVSYDFMNRARSLANAPLIQPFNKITGVTDNYQYGYGHLESSLASELSLNGQPAAPTIIVQVNTMDAASFNQNAGKIATALQTAISNGHAVRKSLLQVARPH